jgi:hypothetical protein
VTGFPWAIVAAESVILIAIAVRGWRRTGRLVDTLAELPRSPAPGEVAALADVFDAVARNSEHGGTPEEFATAALTWMRQQGGTP